MATHSQLPCDLRLRVSLCLIVRNAAHDLPRCLGSAADLVDEIVVVDTGSTDGTADVARSFGALVTTFAWADSFAAARNESLRHARGDWIFWLDADEWLATPDRDKLRALIGRLDGRNVAYVMQQRSPPTKKAIAALVADQVRLFRRAADIAWEYRVHEQILPAVSRAGGTIFQTDIAIQHDGYEDPAVRWQKHERNLRLLGLERAERPDDPFVLFNLGWTCLHLDRPTEALPLLRRSLSLAQPGNSLTRKLHALVVQGHRRLGQLEMALAACRAGRAAFPDDLELLYLEADVLREVGDKAGAEECLRQLLAAPTEPYFAMGVDPGLRGSQGRYLLGLVYRERRNLPAAAEQFRRVVEEQPQHTAAWVGLADLYLAQGCPGDAEQLAARLADDPARFIEVAVIRARLHEARGEFKVAREILEVVIAREPDSVWPRVALSQVLLREGQDWSAAEQCLRNVLRLDPNHGITRRNLAVLLRRRHREE